MFWNPDWNEMPWKAYTSPAERYQELPSFVVGEWLAMFTSFILLLHAMRESRTHRMVWLLSFIVGTANDAIFMFLPLVDNFWQAQASVMLTPRMPLYIPCMYNIFMYTSTVAAWRFKLPTVAEACLAGIMGEMIYAPYDITGNKFLWWTWHDTDAPIRVRNFGAPVGSTVWVITFTATFAFLVRAMIIGDTWDWDTNRKKFHVPGISDNIPDMIGVSLLTTPLMMVHMAFLQFVCRDSQGLPTNRSLVACLVLYSLIIAKGIHTATQPPEAGEYVAHRGIITDHLRSEGKLSTKEEDEKKRMVEEAKRQRELNVLCPNPSSGWMPRLVISLHFFFHAINWVVSDPTAHVSTGVHQTVGPCDETAVDFAGHERNVFLCPKNYDEEFSFKCGGKDLSPSGTSQWYTLCGVAHTEYSNRLLAQVFLAVAGVVTYGAAFSLSPEEKKGRKNKAA